MRWPLNLARLACLAAVLAAAAAAALPGLVAGAAAAPSAAELRQKVAAAESEAKALRSALSQARERMFAAEAEADRAGAALSRVEGRLARGERRSAELADQVDGTDALLKAERRRLRRARGNLAARLLAIYIAGPRATDEVAIGATDFDEFLVGAQYMDTIQSADGRLARRVEEVRQRVADELAQLRRDRARAERHRRRLAADRDQVAAISNAAASRAAEARQAAAERDAALSELVSKMDSWAAEVERAERREARQARRAAATETGQEAVERWLGGPYSIPTAIVMCESGGNYSALNPSSGAGGAYQIMPATWAAYGGKGLPHLASKAEQDRIAAQIWADSGPTPWVCKA